MRTKTAIFAYFCSLLIATGSTHLLRAQTAAVPQSPAAQLQDSVNELSVGVGKTILVDTAKPISRVSIGLGDVAIATAVSRTEIMVNGKAPGESSLIIWDSDGNRQFFNLTVHSINTQVIDNLEGVRREMRTELPSQNLRVTMENGSVFLRGTADDLNSAQRAVAIAASVGKVVNLLNVKVPPSEPQILLKVRFASVDRSVEKQLGINLFNLGYGNTVGAVSTGQFSPPTIQGSAGGSSSSGGSGVSGTGGSATFSNEGTIMGFLPGLGIGATLQALESRGLAQELAEPNVLATSGHEASFLAGGQFPYPVVQGTSGGPAAVSLQFKDYGIRLNFIPTITPRGTIRLQVAPEVSALDYANQVQISGFTVPGITTRKVNTEVELGDHESFAIGGLLDNTISETFDKIPFLSSIPILGKFFQSIQRTKNNNELIVIVTPEIVAPMAGGQPVPLPNYPEPFMAPNSNTPMSTPDTKTATTAPAPTEVPVEKLLDSMKPEQTLVVDSTSGTFGSGATTAAAPSQAPTNGVAVTPQQ